MRYLLLTLAACSSFAVCARADEAIKLSGYDLAVQTHKWDGKTIQATGACFYADVNEYRCAVFAGATSAVRIDFEAIEPETARKAIEANCGTMEKMLSPPCRVRFRFVYERYGVMSDTEGRAVPVIFAVDNKATVVGR